MSDGEMNPNGFQPKVGPMSTNWARYCTAEETRQGAAQKTPPSAYTVVSMNVGRVRSEARQEVRHSPLADNRGHTDVIGRRDDEVRLKLFRMVSVVLRPNAD